MKIKFLFTALLFISTIQPTFAAIVTTTITGISPAYGKSSKMLVILHLNDTLSCAGNSSNLLIYHLGYESNAVNSQTSESFMNYSALISAAQRGLSLEVDESQLTWEGGTTNACEIEIHYSNMAKIKGFVFKF